jgi:DNA-binding LacI/PurR family transcriptional regulator
VRGVSANEIEGAVEGASETAAPKGRRRAGMADVAKLAGVSHQTVSRVVNQSLQVKAETRERVEAAMRMLEYRPNRLARALVTGRSQTLGVVSFDTTLYGPASTLLGIERAAHDAGYFTSIVSLRSLDRVSVLEAVDRLRMQGVDGVLFIAPQVGAAHTLLHLPADLAVVAVEAGPDEGVPVVAVDQMEGARLATRHLLELGHKTVWHIAGPGDWLEAQQRVSGWRSTLEEAGVPVPAVLEGDWSARSGYELGSRLLETPDVTAVFVANDQMALGVLRVLHEAGRELPRDVSIVGFDDVPEASYFTPPLTTVRQDFMEMGRRGFHLLLSEIGSGTRSPARETVAPELVVRASTAPPPAT